MVSTRSKSSKKHEGPKSESKVPAKKQKTSKDTQKAVKNDAKEKEEVLKEDEPMTEEPAKEEQNGKPAEEEEKRIEEEPQKAQKTEDKKPEDKQSETAAKNGETNEDTKKQEYTRQLFLSNVSGRKVLEKGIFYFFFRPRVNTENPSSMDDVQKSYLLLRPTKSDIESAQKNVRIIQIPKKKLPATGSHERFLGFVLNSDQDVKALKDDIGESTYSTATRGERVQPAARPVGEGVYAITGDPDGRTSHFAYLLTLPAHATVGSQVGELTD